MSEQETNVKGKLLSEIEREWGALITSLDGLSESQITDIRDPEGWSAKDHLIHMAYWERGVCFYLQGKPRHVGMEIDEELLQHADNDEINAVIQQAQKDMSWAEVQALIHYCHRQLLHSVQSKSNEELTELYRRSEGGKDGSLRLLLCGFDPEGINGRRVGRPSAIGAFGPVVTNSHTFSHLAAERCA